MTSNLYFCLLFFKEESASTAYCHSIAHIKIIMCTGDICLIAMVELFCNYLSSKNYVANRHMTGWKFLYIITENTLSWNKTLDCIALHAPESVVSIATPTVWMAQGSHCSGARFFTHTHIGCEVHPASITEGTEAFFMGKVPVVCPWPPITI
jgi:hypothetical protein